MLFAACLFFISAHHPLSAQTMPGEFAKAVPAGSVSQRWDCYYHMATWHSCPKKIVGGRWLLEPVITEPTLFTTAEFQISEPGRIFVQGSARCDTCTLLEFSLQKWSNRTWEKVTLYSGDLVSVCTTGTSCPDKNFPPADTLPRVEPGRYRLHAHTGVVISGSNWTYYPETEVDITAFFIADESEFKGKIRIVSLFGNDTGLTLSDSTGKKTPGTSGMVVEKNTIITTDVATETNIDLDGGGQIRIGPETEFRIEQITLEAGSISSIKGSLNTGELKGRIPGETGQVELAVTTPTCTVTARDSEFGVRYDQRFRATEIKAASGKISATCPADSVEKMINADQWAIIDWDCNVNSGTMNPAEISTIISAFSPLPDLPSVPQSEGPADAIIPAAAPEDVNNDTSPAPFEPAPPEPPPARDITGAWRLIQENGYPGTLVIAEQNGENVAGTLSWDNFAMAPIRGTLKGERLEFAVDFGSGLTETSTAELDPEGKELVNGITASITGENISWSGSRMEPPPE